MPRSARVSIASMYLLPVVEGGLRLDCFFLLLQQSRGLLLNWFLFCLVSTAFLASKKIKCVLLGPTPQHLTASHFSLTSHKLIVSNMLSIRAFESKTLSLVPLFSPHLWRLNDRTVQKKQSGSVSARRNKRKKKTK